MKQHLFFKTYVYTSLTNTSSYGLGKGRFGDRFLRNAIYLSDVLNKNTSSFFETYYLFILEIAKGEFDKSKLDIIKFNEIKFEVHYFILTKEK